jgi:hypothetical protein
VKIHDCNGGSNQQWTLTSAGELRVYGNKCLEAYRRATAPGTVVDIYDCGGAHQRWTLAEDGTVRGVQSGLCLDVSGAATANGSAVILWSRSGAANQQWRRS